MMIRSSIRILVILFAVIGIIAFPASSALAAWKTTKINEITYVPLSDCAAAFSMAAAKPRKDKRELAFAGEFHFPL